jgi:hypothetical protein
VRPKASVAVTLSVRGTMAPGTLTVVEKLPSHAIGTVFVAMGVPLL